MKLQKFPTPGISRPMHDFLEQLHGLELLHLASELLQEGLSADDIAEALQRAYRICETAELELPRHFHFIYTQSERGIFHDCRLSKLAYGLVLINANPRNKTVAECQIRLLSNRKEKVPYRRPF